MENVIPDSHFKKARDRQIEHPAPFLWYRVGDEFPASGGCERPGCGMQPGPGFAGELLSLT